MAHQGVVAEGQYVVDVAVAAADAALFAAVEDGMKMCCAGLGAVAAVYDPTVAAETDVGESGPQALPQQPLILFLVLLCFSSWTPDMPVSCAQTLDCLHP